MALLVAPVRAQRQLLDTVPPTTRITGLHDAFEGDVRELPLRGTGALHALAVAGDTVWIARGERLFRHDLSSLELLVDVPAPAGLVDLAADRRFLYGLEADGAVVVIDPRAGRVVREHRQIAYGDDAPRFAALATGDDGLVLADEHGGLWRVDAALQRGERVVGAGARAEDPSWLGRRGDTLVFGGKRLVFDLDARDGDTGRLLALPIVQQVGDVAGDDLWIGGEPPDRPGGAGLWVFTPWPERWRTTVSVCRDRNGAPAWAIGPRVIRDAAQLSAALAELHRRVGQSRTDDRGLVPTPLVLRPSDTSTVGDLATTWDLATRAGWTEVRVAGLRAWVERQKAR